MGLYLITPAMAMGSHFVMYLAKMQRYVNLRNLVPEQIVGSTAMQPLLDTPGEECMHGFFAFVDTWYVVVVPIIGVQGFRWAIDNDRQGSFSIKEFDEQCLKLRVARGNLWHYSFSRRDLPDILLSAARSLFEQIIYAHKKSFGEEKYAEIRATFDCIHGHKNKYEKLQSLSSLIASSSHSRLTSSLDSFVMPLSRTLPSKFISR
ncbi:hypothetical protein IFM89_002503 [Coptis chinensis]|uniref:Uncharacterized protein n=1 Tax=Coptis chinensis TaxID=261450 RepID=A0A835HIQ5_9MAGN|nr:hypothetical protein IFM89_002503 [Coptis chinensis]